MTEPLQIQPYTYYNPDGKVPLWIVVVSGVAMVGLGILLFGRDDAYPTGAVTTGGGAGSDPDPEPPLPPPPGPGTIAPGPGTPPPPLPPPPPPPPPPAFPGDFKPADPDPDPPVDPDPGAATPGPIDFETTGAGNLADYPWGDDGKVYIHPTTPTPSMFYRVKQGNTLDMTVRNAVGSALALAGRPDLAAYMNPNHGGTTQEWAKRLRQQMRDGLICGWWNDTAYGQTSQQKAGGTGSMGPNGRGLNWTPVHRDNIGLLAGGSAAERSTTMSGNRDSDFTPSQASRHMDLWIPAVNLDALKTLPKEQLNLLFDVEWKNGLRAINPPPQVSEALGVNFALFVGGCPGWIQG